MTLQWLPAGNNRGPQGDQGVPGPAGATGPAGPSGVTTLRGATDYDNTNAPVEGDAIIWVPGSPGKFTPRQLVDTNGRVLSSKMPFVFSPVRSGTVSSVVNSDAGSGAGNYINLSVTGNATFNLVGTPSDFQQIRIHAVASGAARTFTFGSGFLPAKNLPLGLGPYSLARGDVLVGLAEYIGNHATTADVAAPSWALLAAAIV